MIIVFDTNIYIAAFRGRGFSYELLLRTLDPGSGHLVYFSSAIKAELIKELQTEFSLAETGNFTLILDEFTHKIEPIEKINAVKEDPDDNKVLECAVAAEADLIVTMDKDLLKLKSFRHIGIVHPKAFSYMFPKE